MNKKFEIVHNSSVRNSVNDRAVLLLSCFCFKSLFSGLKVYIMSIYNGRKERLKGFDVQACWQVGQLRSGQHHFSFTPWEHKRNKHQIWSEKQAYLLLLSLTRSLPRVCDWHCPGQNDPDRWVHVDGIIENQFPKVNWSTTPKVNSSCFLELTRNILKYKQCVTAIVNILQNHCPDDEAG